MFDTAKHEPSLQEMLDDPIVRLLMMKDGVEAADLMPQLERAMQTLPPRPVAMADA